MKKPDPRDRRRSAPSTPAAISLGWQARSLAPLVLAGLLLGISIAVRILARDVITSDLEVFVLRWYAKFQELGIRAGLGKDFYNYAPPYVYLVALATLTSRLMPAVISIKLISTAFDAFSAFMMYKIVRLRFPEGYLPLLAAALLFAAPTVVANTAVWGQADSTYTAFLLTCLFFMLSKKPLPAMFFLAVSFAFKPQAIFLLPLFAVVALRKEVPWYAFLLLPGVYALGAAPAVAFGRTWPEIIDIYLSRPGEGKALTHNAASAYVFVPQSAVSVLGGAGLVLGATVVLLWMVYTWRSTRHMDGGTLLLLALISVTLTPFVLPNMHDRYFYPSDVVSIALAFSLPELWFVPVLFQVISGLSYSIYLLSASADNLAMAAGLNLCALVILVARQITLRREHPASAGPSPLPA